MAELYKHQEQGVAFLRARRAAMLCDEMGLGKTRQALVAAACCADIDRILVLCPAAVRYSWRTELEKLGGYIVCEYDAKSSKVTAARAGRDGLPILIISYSLLPREKHEDALTEWCLAGDALLICDESSFLKNRTAKQTKASARIGKSCRRRWLLTGTPVANSPLDLWGQGVVMAGGINGPLKHFANWWHFRARYAVLRQMKIGAQRFQQVVDYQNIDELTQAFAPYVLRREKRECLDLPAKMYEVREVALREETWRIYQELKREAMLCLPDTEEKPEPNAAVRLLRLCQLTSGHVGSFGVNVDGKLQEEVLLAIDDEIFGSVPFSTRDTSDEKLRWLADEIVDGELSAQRAVIVWCRWRRERERLAAMLVGEKPENLNSRILICELFGGQSETHRKNNLDLFCEPYVIGRRVLLAQPHAGGFGLNLIAASTAVYLSNDFSYTTRIQSEDRCHRIGQHNPCTYIDVLATGPRGQRTVDHHVLDVLMQKRSLADMTCAAWKRILQEE